jgi:hypothetical protein
LAINPLGSVDIPLSMFSSLNTELSPSDLPEGLSPENHDVSYIPGSTGTREALHKLYADAISGGVTVVYEKTYVQPNGVELNLILDSSGKFWREDVTNTPGVLTLITSVTPGSLARSVTVNGREYIAISDGKHGNESPRQYDGTNFDRVSQDGPGQPPTISSVIEDPQELSGAGAGSPVNVTTITPTDSVTVYG